MALTKRSVARGRVFHDCQDHEEPASFGLHYKAWRCSICHRWLRDPLSLRDMIRKAQPQ